MCFLVSAAPASVIYTLSLHDALPIWHARLARRPGIVSLTSRIRPASPAGWPLPRKPPSERRQFSSSDRKSTRLNSSHANISYAVFCLKKKKKKYYHLQKLTLISQIIG